MWQAFVEIVRDNWTWRSQARHLAVMDLQRANRGAILGWFWLILKPALYILCFWFALEIGLRATHSSGESPYLVWLASGLMPWFYIKSMLGTGSNAFRANKYLVVGVQFPLAVIPRFVSLSHLLTFFITLPILATIFIAFRFPLTIYALQLPVIIALLYLFFTLWSLMMSPLTAMSRDFMNFLRVCQTPIFWLSGVLFNVNNINVPWIRRLLDINPVTFFVSSFRAAVCDHYWVWERPQMVAPFAAVLILVLLGAVRNYQRFGRVLSDVF
jgi:teichoic acid transport system permease protein